MINKFKLWLINKWATLESLARKHREYIGIMVALLIVWVSPYLIRDIDPSAAPIDPGILSGIILAVVAVLVFNSITWWLIRSIWPVFSEYSNNTFIIDFQSLQPCQRVLIYLGFFLSFVTFLLIALVAIV